MSHKLPPHAPDGDAPRGKSRPKPDPYLVRAATEVVANTIAGMPDNLRQLASTVPVICEPFADEETIAQGFEPDILGLFVGEPVGLETATDNPVPACIILYVDSIWDFSEGRMATFRKEVRLTFLHELGHYLGWDEEQVSAHGLE